MTTHVPVRVLALLETAARAPGYEIPAGVDSALLEQYLRLAGLRPSAQWLAWVSLTNGPRVGPGGFYGVGTISADTDVQEYLTAHPELLRMKLLPVAGDGCGGFWLLACEGAPRPGATFYFDAVRWGECTWDRLEEESSSWFELLERLLVL